MSRLLSTLTLLSLLLLAAAPASGVMVRGEKIAVPDFFWSSFESASDDEWPATQYRTWGGVDCSYEPALDVRDGPNLYAYVVCNPWSKFDSHGLAENEINPSATDVRVINGVYQLSPTARLLQNYANSKGYKVETLKPGSVAKITGVPNGVATVVDSAKRVFVDTMGDDVTKVDWNNRVAVPHEHVHIVQKDIRADAESVPAALREFVNSVRYPELDAQTNMSPAELEAKRVQNIVLQEMGKEMSKNYPILKDYDGTQLPKGTETGKGWVPPANVPNNTPPIPSGSPSATEPRISPKDESAKSESKEKED